MSCQIEPVFTGQMAECLDCRACEAACPSGVTYSALLEPARALVLAHRQAWGSLSWREQAVRAVALRWLFRDLARLRAAAAVARFYQRSGLRRLARRARLPEALGVARLERQLPPMRAQFFPVDGRVYPAVAPRRGRAALLGGCIMSTAFADVQRATVRVLTGNGWDVVVPAGQGCCGALHVHAGELDGARSLLRRNIAAFEAAGADVVISTAAGCGAALKEYGRLLVDDPLWAARAAAFAARARDVTEVLAAEPLRGPLGPVPLTVTYQEPCHLAHAQRLSAEPRSLLRQVPGLRLREMAEASLCCGSAGSYSLAQPEMSDRLLARKLGHALATGAPVIVSANPGCMNHLRAGLEERRAPVQVRHLVELLDLSYRQAR